MRPFSHLLIAILLLGLLAGPVQALPAQPGAPFSPAAQAVLAALPAGAKATFTITLHDQLDPRSVLPPAPSAGIHPSNARLVAAQRSQAVIEGLEAHAAASQQGFLAAARALQAQGQVGKITSLWIFNGISIEADASAIQALARRPEVALIRPDPDPSFKIVPSDDGLSRFAAATTQAPAAPLAPQTSYVQPNIVLTNAPQMWAAGFTGQGVVIASLDTGVDGTHPDLAPSYRGGSNSWFDPYRGTSTPYDPNSQGHGTHTMGIMVGSNTSGDPPSGHGAIGMAPGAKWIAAKIFDDSTGYVEANVHLAFQWALTSGANVVNNSWGFQAFGSCSSSLTVFEPDIAALRAAGVIPVFSAGNSGSGNIPGTDGAPANNPGAFSVGAIDNTSVTWYSSARGPNACDSSLPFPYLAAPGVSVLSSVADLIPGVANYATLTGTSMAAPHVTGAIALLLSALPGLPANLQEYALTQGAFDLAPAGVDINTGYGRLDVYHSYQVVQSLWNPPFKMYVPLDRFLFEYFLPYQ